MLLAGVAGALVLRALLIGAGIALMQKDCVMYPFAALILLAAWRMPGQLTTSVKESEAACSAAVLTTNR